jgi:hypothetical protein
VTGEGLPSSACQNRYVTDLTSLRLRPAVESATLRIPLVRPLQRYSLLQDRPQSDSAKSGELFTSKVIDILSPRKCLSMAPSRSMSITDDPLVCMVTFGTEADHGGRTEVTALSQKTAQTRLHCKAGRMLLQEVHALSVVFLYRHKAGILGWRDVRTRDVFL